MTRRDNLQLARTYFINLQRKTKRKANIYKFLNIILPIITCIIGVIITYNADNKFLTSISFKLLGLWICLYEALNHTLTLRWCETSNMQVYLLCQQYISEIDLKLHDESSNTDDVTKYLEDIFDRFRLLKLSPLTGGDLRS